MQNFHWRSGVAWRVLKLGFVFAAAGLVAHGILGSNGLLTYLQKRREYTALHRQIQQMRQQNLDLQKEVQGLKSDPAAIEEHAREDLHMARQNEKIYILQSSHPSSPDLTQKPSDPPPRNP